MKTRQLRTPVLTFGLIAALLSGAGCYERVVEARGFGSSRFDVEPAYRSETVLDHAFDTYLGTPEQSDPAWRAVQVPEVKTMSTGQRTPQ